MWLFYTYESVVPNDTHPRAAVPLQNGKAVSAAIHVVVDGLTRGYGIIAKNMLSATDQKARAQCPCLLLGVILTENCIN